MTSQYGLGRFRLDGRVAIITGAARGQGAAEARLFAEAGASVVITDVLAEGKEVAEELGDQGLFMHHDISKPEDWGAVVSTALEHFGSVDVLVNNAAVHWARPLIEEDPEAFKKLLAINLVGPFLGIQAVVDAMRQRSGGSIINVSSTAGIGGYVGLTAYASSKWGLRGLTKTAAVELGQYGIRVNTIIPGSVNTPMMSRIPDPEGNRFSNLPLSRYAEPEEVAPAVLFLASDASSYMTGAELAIDGGASAKMVGGPTPAQREAARSH